MKSGNWFLNKWLALFTDIPLLRWFIIFLHEVFVDTLIIMFEGLDASSHVWDPVFVGGKTGSSVDSTNNPGGDPSSPGRAVKDPEDWGTLPTALTDVSDPLNPTDSVINGYESAKNKSEDIRDSSDASDARDATDSEL